MIQRIQTLWLALTAISAGILCSADIIKFSSSTGSELLLTFSAISRHTGEANEYLASTLPVSVVLIVIALLSIVTIFLYRKLGLQHKATLILITCSILLIGLLIYYSLKVINGYDARPVPGLMILFPLFISVFSVLAYRGIRKDEKLLESYNRLR